MKKLVLILGIITSVYFISNAQKGVFFFGTSFSVMTEYGGTEVAKTQVDYLYQGHYYKLNKFTRYDFFSPITTSFAFRLNVLKINPENSLSVCFYPNISLSIYKYNLDDEFYLNPVKGYGKIDLPVYLCYNWGLGSTYMSSKNFGLFLGGGFELSKYPLMEVRSDYWLGFQSQKDPFIIFGIRYWSLWTILNEINFKFSFGDKTVIPVDYQTHIFGIDYSENMMESKAFCFRLAWVRYFRY
jgi:hypothetical protein